MTDKGVCPVCNLWRGIFVLATRKVVMRDHTDSFKGDGSLCAGSGQTPVPTGPAVAEPRRKGGCNCGR